MPKFVDTGSVILKVSPSSKRILFGCIALVVVAGIGYSSYRWCLGKLLKQGGYQAVQLSDGRMYFGRLENPWSQYVRITDVYYFQSTEAGTGEMTLIKLGKEAHGPEDKLEINREHVLFIQDLKSDSKVVKAIKDFKGN